MKHMRAKNGFTILELLVVIAIIGIIAVMLVVAIDDSRQKGRDSNRASQMQEFLKAVELFYTDNGRYPDDNLADPTGYTPIENVTEILTANGGQLARFPADPVFGAADGYQYCASEDLDSMTILIHAESGARGYCTASRGSDTVASYCDTSLITVSGTCADRF